MTTTNATYLVNLAATLRSRIIETSSKTGTPHLGSCLSCVDILTALYFDVLRIDVSNPRDAARDRCILSKGHAAMGLFHVLAERGFYPLSKLENYGENGGVFGEHPPSPKELAGIEAATGSLGHGLPLGLGMALSARIQLQKYNVYVVLGDGECNEGTIWEAAMLAAAQKVSNLCVVIDFNKWQATGRSREVMALAPLMDKWLAFGWNAVEVDGHSFDELLGAFSKFPSENGRPTAIVAHTIKGKGASFMEDDNNWHYRIPTPEEVEKAKIELGFAL